MDGGVEKIRAERVERLTKSIQETIFRARRSSGKELGLGELVSKSYELGEKGERGILREIMERLSKTPDISDRVTWAVNELFEVDTEYLSEFSPENCTFAPYITLSRLSPEERSRVFEQVGDNFLKQEYGGPHWIRALKAYIAAGKRDKIADVFVVHIMSGREEGSYSLWKNAATTLIGLGFESEVRSAMQELSRGGYIEQRLGALATMDISEVIIGVGKLLGCTEDLEILRDKLKENGSSMVGAADRAIAESKIIRAASEEYGDEDALLEAAKSLSAQGEQETALLYFDALIMRNPEHPWVHYDKGHVFLQIGDISGAINCFESAVNVNPHTQNYYSLAYALSQDGNDDIARIELDLALEKDPENQYAKSLLAALPGSSEFEGQGDLSYKKALEIDGDDTRHQELRNVITAYLAAGAKQKLIRVLREQITYFAREDVEYSVAHISGEEELEEIRGIGLTIAKDPNSRVRTLAVPMLKKIGNAEELIGLGNSNLDYHKPRDWQGARLAYEAAGHQPGLDRLNREFERDFIFTPEESAAIGQE